MPNKVVLKIEGVPNVNILAGKTITLPQSAAEKLKPFSKPKTFAFGSDPDQTVTSASVPGLSISLHGNSITITSEDYSKHGEKIADVIRGIAAAVKDAEIKKKAAGTTADYTLTVEADYPEAYKEQIEKLFTETNSTQVKINPPATKKLNPHDEVVQALTRRKDAKELEEEMKKQGEAGKKASADAAAATTAAKEAAPVPSAATTAAVEPVAAAASPITAAVKPVVDPAAPVVVSPAAATPEATLRAPTRPAPPPPATAAKPVVDPVAPVVLPTTAAAPPPPPPMPSRLLTTPPGKKKLKADALTTPASPPSAVTAPTGSDIRKGLVAQAEPALRKTVYTEEECRLLNEAIDSMDSQTVSYLLEDFEGKERKSKPPVVSNLVDALAANLQQRRVGIQEKPATSEDDDDWEEDLDDDSTAEDRQKADAAAAEKRKEALKVIFKATKNKKILEELIKDEKVPEAVRVAYEALTKAKPAAQPLPATPVKKAATSLATAVPPAPPTSPAPPPPSTAEGAAPPEVRMPARPTSKTAAPSAATTIAGAPISPATDKEINSILKKAEELIVAAYGRPLEGFLHNLPNNEGGASKWQYGSNRTQAGVYYYSNGEHIVYLTEDGPEVCEQSNGINKVKVDDATKAKVLAELKGVVHNLDEKLARAKVVAASPHSTPAAPATVVPVPVATSSPSAMAAPTAKLADTDASILLMLRKKAVELLKHNSAKPSQLIPVPNTTGDSGWVYGRSTVPEFYSYRNEKYEVFLADNELGVEYDGTGNEVTPEIKRQVLTELETLLEPLEANLEHAKARTDAVSGPDLGDVLDQLATVTAASAAVAPVAAEPTTTLTASSTSAVPLLGIRVTSATPAPIPMPVPTYAAVSPSSASTSRSGFFGAIADGVSRFVSRFVPPAMSTAPAPAAAVPPLFTANAVGLVKSHISHFAEVTCSSDGNSLSITAKTPTLTTQQCEDLTSAAVLAIAGKPVIMAINGGSYEEIKAVLNQLNGPTTNKVQVELGVAVRTKLRAAGQLAEIETLVSARNGSSPSLRLPPNPLDPASLGDTPNPPVLYSPAGAAASSSAAPAPDQQQLRELASVKQHLSDYIDQILLRMSSIADRHSAIAADKERLEVIKLELIALKQQIKVADGFVEGHKEFIDKYSNEINVIEARSPIHPSSSPKRK